MFPVARKRCPAAQPAKHRRASRCYGPVPSRVGATVTYPTPPYPSTTLGYQPDEREAAGWRVNKFGPDPRHQEHVLSDGSQSPAAAACNPTLTIVSRAIRQGTTSASRCSARRSKPPQISGSVRHGTEPLPFTSAETYSARATRRLPACHEVRDKAALLGDR